jgi:catechol 2,3-dioxygenase-like lactoylglutathione lyase family enzyme
MITGIAHVNLVVPPGTLDHAKDFYGRTLGFHPVSPPAIMQDVLAWWVNKRFIPIRGIAFTTGRTSPWGIELTHGIIGSI